MAPSKSMVRPLDSTPLTQPRVMTPTVEATPDPLPATTAETSGPTSSPTATSSHTALMAHRAGEGWSAHQLHQRFEQSVRRLDDDEAFDTLSGGDDHITREDLERVRDGEVTASAQLRDEAAFLLEGDAFRNALDLGAGKGEVDDKISRDDIRGVRTDLERSDWRGETIGVDGVIDSEAEARAVLDRYVLLADGAAGAGSRNGHYSNDDVRALLDDPNIPDDLRAAARFIEDGEVSLPGTGRGFWGTALSPFTDGAGWVGDRGRDAGQYVGDRARDGLFPPVQLTDAQRAELVAHASGVDDGRDVNDGPHNRQTNAHYSNTPEQMREALDGDYDWIEGDIRRDPPVMGHDYHSSGGFTLDDWLEIGGASGRGLKLDIKEAGSIDGVIESIQNADVPQDRLMLNVDAVTGPGGSGVNASPDDVRRLREEFPDAHIAIGATTAPSAPGTTYTEAQVSEMIALAEDVGGSVFFPLRAEMVTPQIVERLEAHGSVSIWNSAGRTATDPQPFLDMGVTGIIDLR